MKLQLFCGTCMVNQAIMVMNLRSIQPEQQLKIINSLIQDIPQTLSQPTPSHFQSILLHNFANYMQMTDVYAEDKVKQNEMAAKLLPLARAIIQKSDNPLFTAALFSVEGNSIDQLFLNNSNLESRIHDIEDHKFAIDHYDFFIEKAKISNNILFVLDNAGELFFDALFVETLQNWRIHNNIPAAEVTFIVKGGPILNDATDEDAIKADLHQYGRVINSGSNFLGCPIDHINVDALDALASAELIIAKGQANFETLEDNQDLRHKIFFLLKAKCIHVSAFLNVAEGSSILFSPAN